MICYISAAAAGIIQENDANSGIVEGTGDGNFYVVWATTDRLHIFDDSEQCYVWQKLRRSACDEVK